MVRNYYSYWLSVKPADSNITPALAKSYLEDILLKFQDTELANIMDFDLDGSELSAELSDETGGAIEEDTSLIDIVADVAATYIDAVFIFNENDEDDHSNARETKYAGGKLVYTNYARTIEPGCIDRDTVDKIVTYLKDNGWPDVADTVLAEFT